MPEIKLTPFIGIDNVTPDPNRAQGALSDAVNTNIDLAGNATRRAGYSVASAGITSVGKSAALNRVLGIYAGALVWLDPEALVRNALGPVADSELEYVDVNDETVVAGLNTLAVIRGGSFMSLGVEQPPAPILGLATSGGLRAGKYGVLITFVAADGEESAASEAVFMTVAEGGGISITALPTPFETKTQYVRAYRTECDGDVFYNAGRVTSGGVLGTTTLGRAADTRHMRRMRGGRYLRYWRGRIVVARGRTLYMSEAMRYGLLDERHGFVQLPTRITFIQPVEGGIFVGQTNGVVFLAGTTPKDLNVVRTGAGTPTPGTSTEISSDDMTGDFLQQGAQMHAAWWGNHGYAIGFPNGAVFEPQFRRLRVPVGQRGASAVHERRLISLVS